MATAVIEEHTTCAVCFHVFREPRQLRCLHTFCEQCIDRLTKNNEVVCPHCRETTETMDVRKDFKTQNLIEAQREWSNISDAPKCGMCHKFVKTLDTYCGECDLSICSSCSYIHKEMKVTKSHQTKPTKHLVSYLNENLQETIDFLTQEKVDLTENINKKTETSIQKIKKREAENIEEVVGYFRSAVERLNVAETECCNEIREESQKLVADTLQAKKYYLECGRKIQTNIDELCSIVKHGDVIKLNDAQSVAKSDSRAFVQDIKRELPSIDLEAMTRLEIKKTGTFYPNKMIEVFVVPRTGNIVGQEGIFCKTDNSKYRATVSVKTGRDVSRITMINGDLWCSSDKGIFVFDKNCVMTKKIVHRKVIKVTGITNGRSGNIIVGCDTNNGIHELSHSGEYVTCISPRGHYSDVCFFGGKLYALNYEQCTIGIFQHKNNTWIKVEDRGLKYINGNCADTLKVHSGGVYVSFVNNSFIHKYTERGEFTGQIGKQGGICPGELESPRITRIDDCGNLIVCDSGNRCIQVYDTDEEWHKVELLGTMTLNDVVVEKEGNDVFIWIAGLHRIMKYVKCS